MGWVAVLLHPTPRKEPEFEMVVFKDLRCLAALPADDDSASRRSANWARQGRSPGMVTLGVAMEGHLLVITHHVLMA